MEFWLLNGPSSAPSSVTGAYRECDRTRSSQVTSSPPEAWTARTSRWRASSRARAGPCGWWRTGWRTRCCATPTCASSGCPSPRVRICWASRCWSGGPLLGPAHAGRRRQVVANGGNCDGARRQLGPLRPRRRYSPEGPLGAALRRLKGLVSHRCTWSASGAALRRARIIVANSERTRQDMLAGDRGGPSRGSTSSIWAATPRAFPPTSPELRRESRAALGWPGGAAVALFVGALGDRRKGFDTLFAAWARLCARRAGTWT